MGTFRAALLVGVGGFFGAIARYLVGAWVQNRVGTAWPLGTFLINMSGCFLIGFVLTFTTQRVTPQAWHFVIPVGFIGAYTTFSTYEYETVKLIQAGAMWRAVSYVALSTVIGFAAVVLAMWTARRF
jgi:CrcB protein